MILFFPALAACLYAVGSMGLKKSMLAGTVPRRVMAVSNIAMALWAAPLFFLFEGTWDTGAWWTAVGAGAALFTGRICAIKALEAGDVSIVAPLLGMKTVLVALLSMVFFPFEMTWPLFWSAVLASGGVALLQKGPVSRRKGTQKAACFALGASLLFALTDVSVQGSAQTLGAGYYLPTLFFTVAFLTPLLGVHPSPPPGGKKSLYFGSGIIGFQTTLMVLVIAMAGNATLVNIVYSTRALWSVLVDRAVGEAHIKDYLLPRLTGAILITAAVVMAIFSKLV